LPASQPRTPDATTATDATTAEPLTRRIHLTAAGVSVLLDVTEGRIPTVVHWAHHWAP
jgi:alpha-galactosidase